ncbi:MAG TPA: carotenoid biosynthesis protein [Candidatus Binatia bacterium]|nr:carotenoid biosynthesis protein [Candidatus Binatia bacterium]
MASTAVQGGNLVAERSRFGWLSWPLLAIYVLWIAALKSVAARSLSIAGVQLSDQLLLAAFFVSHALAYYSGAEVAVYALSSAFIANLFENLSVTYGFPFGYYYHTALAGPRLFHVPYIVTMIYITVGYLSCMVAQVLLGRRDYSSWRRMVYLAPLIAAFVFTSWDLCIDPIYGTIYRAYIYRDPGVWFGTPGGNYFGWLLTTYLFYLLFSVFVSRHAGAAGKARREPGRSYWLQPVLLYLVIAVGVVLTNIRGASADVTVSSGKVWNTGDIYGASTLVTIFTMVFISLLALASLYGNRDAREPEGARYRAIQKG